MKHPISLFFIMLYVIIGCAQKNGVIEDPLASKGMQLVWSDNFDYPNEQLDTKWNSQNGPNTHILCSRWRENAVVDNGILYLKNKKENRGGQEWTSASIWTKETFQYGRFECRYKYAMATGTNNSFWIMTTGNNPQQGKKFEIDINEGHYPSEMATNLHNWTDITTDPVTGKSTHPSSSKSFSFSSAKPDVTIQLEIPVTTKRIRFSSNYGAHFHIQEFRIFSVNAAGYPSAFSPAADRDVAGLINFVRDPLTKISASGVYGVGYEVQNVADGGLDKHWVSQVNGEKWLEFEFKTNKVMRRAKNEFCHSPAPVYLSEAIISWAGEVTDAIDGTSMEIDWVKIYQLK